MIRKFRKKPVVIEAEQYDSEANPPQRGVCWTGHAGTHRKTAMFPHLHTIHADQTVRLEHGDWIIPEADGVHFYPCKPDVFTATYEPVTVKS